MFFKKNNPKLIAMAITFDFQFISGQYLLFHIYGFILVVLYYIQAAISPLPCFEMILLRGQTHPIPIPGERGPTPTSPAFSKRSGVSAGALPM